MLEFIDEKLGKILTSIDKILEKLPLGIHSILLFVFTAILVFCNHSFFRVMHKQSLGALYTNVQFDTTIPLYNLYKNSIQNWSYYLFFITDLLWAPILLLMLYRILKKTIHSETVLKLIVILFLTALVFDFSENILYLIYKISYVEYVKLIKIVLYSIGFVTFLFSVIVDDKKIIWRFIKNARISLVFIVIVSFLVGSVDQGGDIMITLFEDRFNLIFTLLLLYFTSIPTAHYPIYFKGSKYSNTSLYEYIMSKRFTLNSYLGIIYFTKRRGITNKDAPQNSISEEFKMQLLRRCLGVLFFIAFFYMILTAVDKAYFLRISSSVTFIVAVFLFWLVWYLSRLKLQTDKFFDNESNNDSSVKKFTRLVRFFPYLLLIDIIFLIVIALCVTPVWNKYVVCLTIVLTILGGITYALFVTGRSYFKYIFTNNWTDYLLENPEGYIEPKREKYYKDYKGASFNFISIFSNNVWYLFFIAFFGIISVATIFLLNFNWKLVHYFNPILIFLMLYLFFYGVVVIYIKHFKYYTQKSKSFLDDEKNKPKWRLWVYHIPYTLILIALIGVYATYKGNDLHELQTKPQITNRGIEFNKYINAIKNKDKHYFVASYGGGLKSNLWTMLLLNKLDSLDSKFIKTTRCFSGISGGSVGIANYTYIKAFNIENRGEVINRLAGLNALSSDLLYLLSGDLAREYIPFNIFKGKDRSHYGMRQHILAINNFKGNTQDSITFYNVYEKAFNQGYYPPLIINTISTHNKYGNALSLKLNDSIRINDSLALKINDKDYKKIFPGAINILNFDKQAEQLPFYTVTSTSNRFPFVSPAAKIKGKGHFLDGGAFENSGLISAYSFKNFLQQYNIIQKTDSIRFINFVNSKSNYIQQLLHNNGIIVDKIKESAEFTSVLNVGAATEHLPNYIRDMLKNKKEIDNIYLPHYFDYNDVVNVLGGKPKINEKTLQKVVKLIDANNKQILTTLEEQGYEVDRRGVVQPATGRLLSDSSIKYQKAMLNHPDVKNKITKILAYLK